MTAPARRVLAAVAAVLSLALVTGCGPSMGDLPLPGSGVRGDTVTVKVRFDEALNLAQGAAVKVNGVNSGRVREVTTHDFKAVAVLEVRTAAHLRRTATARLRYTTPLGELFVDVTNPAHGPELADGAELDPRQASTAPTVEDALSSASLLINGGGLAQLQVVTTELNKALGGREDRVRRLLARSNAFLTSANATTADFLAALDALAGLSRTLKANRSTINAALRDLRPAARVLRRNTPAFTRLLDQVNRFAGTANRVVGATRDDLLTMLRQISPILDEFLANERVLGPSLRALVGAGDKLDAIIPGDYGNLNLDMEVDKANYPVIGTPGSPSGGGSGGSGGGPGGGLLGGLLSGLGSSGASGTSGTSGGAAGNGGNALSPLGLGGLLGGGR